MITYDEKLDFDRKVPKRKKDKDVWNILDEYPLQWLNEVDQDGEFVENWDPFGNNFGIGYYKDGSIAAGFRLECTDPQFLGQTQANAMHTYLNAALTSIQKAENIQFLWYSLDEDEETLISYLNERDGLKLHPIQAYTKDQIVKRDRERLHKGELKSYRCAVFVNIPYFGKDTSHQEESMLKGVWRNMKSFPKMFVELAGLTNINQVSPEKEALLKLTKEAVQRARSVMNSFAASPGITTRPLGATEFYRISRRTWSPTHWKNDKLTNGKTLETLFGPLKYGIPSYVLLEEINDERSWTWQTGKHWHRLLSLRIPPSGGDVGLMIAAIGAQDNAHIYNSEYSLTMRPTKNSEVARALHANLKLYTKMYEGNEKEHQNIKPIIEDMREQLSKLTRDESSNVFECHLFIHIWDEDETKLDTWEKGLIQAFTMEPLKARFSLEEFNGLPYYMGYCTPGFTRCKDSERKILFLTPEASTIIPLLGQATGFVQADPKGRRAPMLMETHRGTLYQQDDFARGNVIAWNGVSVGTTGSGKSMYYNLKIARTISPKDKFIILDGAMADGSYRPICNLMGGNYVDTSLGREEQTYSINPLFTEELPGGRYREPMTDELNRMTLNIEPMLRKRTNEPLDETEKAIITTGINLAFESMRDEKGRVFLHSVAQALNKRYEKEGGKTAERALEMAEHLYSQWCFPNGPYRYFVDRPTQHSDKNLIVYDLKGLSENPTLKGVMVASYLNRIDALVRENMALPAEEQYRIHVYIDEAWNSLMDPTMVQSLVALYRAGRARNISTHCLTQLMADFRKILVISDPNSGSSELDTTNNAILGNCTWFNLFKHDPSDSEVTKEVLNLPTEQALEVANLGTLPGKHREMVQYVRLNNGNAFSKLLIRPLPFELKAYTSDVQELGRKRSVRNQIQNTWDESLDLQKTRDNAIDQLEEMGFKGAESLTDGQIQEILTINQSLKNQ